MTYAELGQARGISEESALKLALRRKWRKQDDNRGQVRVYVSIAWTAALRADMSRAISVLDAVVATLKQELARGNARFEGKRARSEALQVQLDQAQAEATEAARAAAELRQADMSGRRSGAWRVSERLGWGNRDAHHPQCADSVAGHVAEHDGRGELHGWGCGADRSGIFPWRRQHPGAFDRDRRHYLINRSRRVARARTDHTRRVAVVTALQWFAFVILPVAVVVLGGVAAWAGRRFIP
jgi:hypothetical protein